MEFLRGHYRTANVHLQNGLKLLGELHGRSTSDEKDIIGLKPPRNFVDGYIIETFIRLQSQAFLLGQASEDFYLVEQNFEPDSSAAAFDSVIEARGSLDRILNEVFHLTEQSSRQGHNSMDLLGRQRLMQSELSSWLKRYKESQFHLGNRSTPKDKFCYQVLNFYYTMAKIMANTCIWSTSQSIFDSQLQNFVSLITQSIEIYKIIMSIPESIMLPGISTDMSDAVAEMGWVSLLYHTALKCRNHRARLQAIMLLRSIPHKEGMWDATIAVSITKQVMEMEEQDFYQDFEKYDDFPLCSIPEERDLLLPILPEPNRLYEVQVLLPDSDIERVKLTCKRKLKNGDCEVIVRECEVLPQIQVTKPGRARLC